MFRRPWVCEIEKKLKQIVTAWILCETAWYFRHQKQILNFELIK